MGLGGSDHGFKGGSGVWGVVNVITNYFDLYSGFFGEFRFLIHI